MDKERQLYQMVQKGFKEISDSIKSKKTQIEGAELVTIKGKPGDDGYTPKKGVDYFTNEEISWFVTEITKKIRVPKDGDPGKPGNPGKDAVVDYKKIEKFVRAEIEKIPKPDKPEPVHVDSIIVEVLKKLPKQKEIVVDYPKILDFCRKEIEKIENNRDSRVRTLNSGGPTTRLHEISDVEVEGITVGQVISWNGTAWVPLTISQSGGGGFTSLTATETVDGNETVFTFSSATAEPSFIIRDGVLLRKTSSASTVNWTWNGGTKQATLTLPPQDDILAIV